ncbi:MAG: hypothetical protein QM675_12625 [Protaetiibacter sp.]
MYSRGRRAAGLFAVMAAALLSGCTNAAVTPEPSSEESFIGSSVQNAIDHVNGSVAWRDVSEEVLGQPSPEETAAADYVVIASCYSARNSVQLDIVALPSAEVDETITSKAVDGGYRDLLTGCKQ